MTWGHKVSSLAFLLFTLFMKNICSQQQFQVLTFYRSVGSIITEVTFLFFISKRLIAAGRQPRLCPVLCITFFKQFELVSHKSYDNLSSSSK